MLAAGTIAALLFLRSRPAAVSTGAGESVGAYWNLPDSFLGGVVSGMNEAAVALVGSEPRGIRNNNPLNIKWNSVQVWQGQTGADSEGFLIFDKPENGIRAAARILGTYRSNGVVTVRQIIARWTAGDGQALQDAYVSHVASALNLGEGSEVLPARWADLIRVMIKHENGKQPYPDSVILAGIAAA